MSRTANRFTNPVTAAYYDWPQNHLEEERLGKARNIEHTAPTNAVGLVKQQSDESPLVLSWRGHILRKAQHDTMWEWYALCETQSIYIRDFTGDEYEVLITEFNPIRKRTVKNPQDPVNAPLWYWEYTLTMEVLTVRTGALTVVTP